MRLQERSAAQREGITREGVSEWSVENTDAENVQARSRTDAPEIAQRQKLDLKPDARLTQKTSDSKSRGRSRSMT